MIHDTPTPAKRRYSLTERLLSPKSSIVGILLIISGIYVLKLDIDETVRTTTSILLIGSGLTALGLKDKK